MATAGDYATREDVLNAAEQMLGKRLRDVIEAENRAAIESKLEAYGKNRKGFLGDLVEQYVFGISNNARPEADFTLAGIELKTTPLKKHAQRQYVSKERLVFSMINYDTVVSETWETSSFLKKNRLLLLMFYLWLKDQSLLDYEFKFVHFLDLLSDISAEDILQMRKDWEFIVNKIKRGEAHLLSEGDTFYLGACTKATNSKVVRDQPKSRIPAKPRAFSLKQTYLNYLIQSKLLGKASESPSIYRTVKQKAETIETIVADKFRDLIGKTDVEIMERIGWKPVGRPKNFKRLLVNHILTGTGSNEIEELGKANVTLRVITLEPTGTLKESISFPAFDYRDLVNQTWYDEENETMADFHAELETNRFLFVMFQKQKGSTSVILKGFRFWNFPMRDLDEAKRVFDKTVACIREDRYADLPKISESSIAHVRPHGRDSRDTLETPQGTQEPRRCFWLNAKYIQGFLDSDKT